MSTEFRAIREAEQEQCLDLWCAAFRSDSRAYFERYFYGDVEWLPYYTQVAVVDGKVVSAVTICKRTVACGDLRLTMGGIGNVATLPDYRGHGYNTECLKRAIAIMEADAMDFSLLGTGINAYYARVGFATLPVEHLHGTIRADFAPRSTTLPSPEARERGQGVRADCTVRPATADDLPAVRAIYDAYNRTRPIAVVRDEAYWRGWVRISPESVPDTLLVAIGPEGEVLGYVRHQIHRYGGYADVSELGARPEGEAETTAALLEAAAARIQAAGEQSLYFSIALEPTVLSAVDGIVEARQWQTRTGGMVRLLHRDNLLRSVAMGLNELWIAAGRPRGAVTFETPYGPTRLDANGAFLSVEPVEDATGALPQAAFFGLLFGLLPAEQATPDAALHPLLSTLFPPQAFIYYWNGDGF
ncbi:MAG TPA: GNAT family N-acetyltransferase [Chthonomonadaceae bacterium]|nr:GNAT family N-acetyltransferase [Chthonomonadaceae bacterium]